MDSPWRIVSNPERPPGALARSRTIGRTSSRLSSSAAASPAGPAPTTITLGLAPAFAAIASTYHASQRQPARSAPNISGAPENVLLHRHPQFLSPFPPGPPIPQPCPHLRRSSTEKPQR